MQRRNKHRGRSASLSKNGRSAISRQCPHLTARLTTSGSRFLKARRHAKRQLRHEPVSARWPPLQTASATVGGKAAGQWRIPARQVRASFYLFKQSRCARRGRGDMGKTKKMARRLDVASPPYMSIALARSSLLGDDRLFQLSFPWPWILFVCCGRLVFPAHCGLSFLFLSSCRTSCGFNMVSLYSFLALASAVGVLAQGGRAGPRLGFGGVPNARPPIGRPWRGSGQTAGSPQYPLFSAELPIPQLATPD